MWPSLQVSLGSISPAAQIEGGQLGEAGAQVIANGILVAPSQATLVLVEPIMELTNPCIYKDITGTYNIIQYNTI